MKAAEILIIGGDKRHTCCFRLLKDAGHKVNSFLVPELSSPPVTVELLKKYLSTAGYVLCPMPFSRDSINITTSGVYSDTHLSIELLLSLMNEKQTLVGGAIDKNAAAMMTKKDIPYHDLMTFDSLVYANARLTAEGLLKDVIDTVPFSLSEACILILGYGKCGSAIADTMRLMGADVTVYNRNKNYELRAKALGFKTLSLLPADDSLQKYNIIINTVPSVIYTDAHLGFTDKAAYLFETASSPGGFDTEYIKSNGFSYKNCPGIPGKTSPMTAARIICHVLNEEIG